MVIHCERTQSYLCMHTHNAMQIRRPIGTVFELIIPPLAVLFVIGLRYVRVFQKCVSALNEWIYSPFFFYTSFTHTQCVWMKPPSHEANMKAVQVWEGNQILYSIYSHVSMSVPGFSWIAHVHAFTQLAPFGSEPFNEPSVWSSLILASIIADY